MGEDDDLARAGRAVQDAREAVDLGRVHRLHRVVDHREAERRLVERRAREEDADREREQLALRHHAERVRALAVGAHVEVRPPGAAGLLERDVVQVDRRPLPQLAPVLDRALGDRREALRAAASSAAPLTHFSASLSAFSVLARASTSRACSSHAATWVESSCHAAPRLPSSSAARAERARRWTAAAMTSSRGRAASSVRAGHGDRCGGDRGVGVRRRSAGESVGGERRRRAGGGAAAAARPGGRRETDLRGQRRRGAGVRVDQRVDPPSRRGQLRARAASALGPVRRAPSPVSAAWVAQLLVEHVRGAADRAVVGEPLRVADRERAAQQRGDVGRALGVGRGGVLVRALARRAAAVNASRISSSAGQRAGRPAGAGSRCRRCSRARRPAAAAIASRSGLRAPSAAATSAACSSSGSSRATSASSQARRRPCAGCRRPGGRRASDPTSSSMSPRPEHRRQRLVQRRERVEHRRQLGVGQERAERRQVAVPAVRRRAPRPASARPLASS